MSGQSQRGTPGARASWLWPALFAVSLTVNLFLGRAVIAHERQQAALYVRFLELKLAFHGQEIKHQAVLEKLGLITHGEWQAAQARYRERMAETRKKYDAVRHQTGLP